jgi:hypothetical protein
MDSTGTKASPFIPGWNHQPGLKGLPLFFLSCLPPSRVEKTSKTINENDKKLQILKSFDMHVPHATNF